MFRFTIRDVLWLTVVVGMAAGAFATYSRMSAKLAAAEAVRVEVVKDAERLALFADPELVHTGIYRMELDRLRFKYRRGR